MPLNTYSNTVIGSSPVFLNGERSHCRMQECNMGITHGKFSYSSDYNYCLYTYFRKFDLRCPCSAELASGVTTWRSLGHVRHQHVEWRRDANVDRERFGNFNKFIRSYLTNYTGDITRSLVMELLPFRNEVSRVLVNGTTLLKVLEHSVSGYDVTGADPPGKFLQVSGV